MTSVINTRDELHWLIAGCHNESVSVVVTIDPSEHLFPSIAVLIGPSSVITVRPGVQESSLGQWRESSGQWEDDFPRVWLQPSSLCPETWRVRSPAISFKLLLKYQSQRPDLTKIDGGLVGRRVIILLSQTKQKFSQCNYGKTNLIRVSFWPLPPSAPCDNFWQIFLECQYVSSGEFWIAGISAGDPLKSDTSWSSPGLSYYCQITRITVYNILTSY